MTPGRDLTAGAASGAATALAGMSGPPVLIYLILVEAPPRTVRATLLAFFAMIYLATLAAHALTIGVPEQTWLTAGILIPFALIGGFIGRRFVPKEIGFLGESLGSGGQQPPLVSTGQREHVGSIRARVLKDV